MWTSLPFVRRGLGPRRSSRAWALVVYGVVVLGFAVGIVAVEVAWGDPLTSPRSPGATHSFEDAAWHLATGLAIALPARRRSAALLGSLMTLGLDVDHVFGDVLPSVTGRTDHCVVFLVGGSVVMYLLLGRSAGFLTSGAVLGHIALDGGTFALFAPVSTAQYALSFPVTVAMVALAVLAVLLAFRPARHVLEAKTVAAWVAVVIVVSAAFLVFTSGATFLIS